MLALAPKPMEGYPPLGPPPQLPVPNEQSLSGMLRMYPAANAWQ